MKHPVVAGLLFHKFQNTSLFRGDMAQAQEGKTEREVYLRGIFFFYLSFKEPKTR